MPRARIGPVLIGVVAAVGLAGDEPSTASLCAASTGRSRILFVSYPELRRRLNISVMEPDGSHPRNLTETEADESDPVWSPDGDWIAFAAMNDPLEIKSDLYLMRADSSRRRRLTNFPAGTLTGEPTWSPDGKQIVFATATIAFGSRDHPVTPRVLHRIDRDGSNLRQLREGSHPSWSPDGMQILYTGVSHSGPSRRGQSRLFVMDPDGRNPHPLVDREASSGAWSPDGRLIAYCGIGGRYPDSQYTYSDLFMMNADGSHAQRLTNDQYDESAPRWSSDGQRILFSSFDSYGLPHGIFSIDRDGRNRKELPHSDRYAWLGSDLFMLAYRAMRLGPIEKTPAVVRAVEPQFDHLVEAISRGDTDRLRELLRRGADPNAHSGTGKTILMEAAQFGPAAALRILLDHGADPRARMKDGRSALWWAVNGHQLEHAKLLLDGGAPLEAVDGEGRTALMLACQLHVRDLMKLLLDRGAHADTRDKREVTPLIWAARAGDLSAVQILLAGGADVNAQPHAVGVTPLMAAIAAPTNSLAILQVLVDWGADLAAKDSRGRTALAEAEDNHLTEAARFLRAAAIKQSGGHGDLTGATGGRKKLRDK